MRELCGDCGRVLMPLGTSIEPDILDLDRIGMQTTEMMIVRDRGEVSYTPKVVTVCGICYRKRAAEEANR